MRIIRRKSLVSILAVTVATCLPWVASAQDSFPDKPIKLIVPTSTGGLTDNVARLYGEHMAQTLKQPVVTNNMPGGSTVVGVRYLLKSPADGYTLGVLANTFVTLPFVDPKVGFTPSDFVGVANLSESPMILVVSNDSPYKTLEELVAAAKAKPGDLTFASVGVGTTSHIPIELLSQAAGLKLLMIAYKGISKAIPDVMAGRVTMMMGTEGSVGELIRAGKVRALAVTSVARASSLPNVPTFKELGYGSASYTLFLGLVAPAGTPAAVVDALAKAVQAAKNDPKVLTRLKQFGQELPKQTTPAEFQQFITAEATRMKALVESANIKK